MAKACLEGVHLVTLLLSLGLGLLQLGLLVLQGHAHAGLTGDERGALPLRVPQLGLQSLLLPPAALPHHSAQQSNGFSRP